ncbi:MAG: hypothetical protein ABL959_03830 [Pyrinomonadaceae bacterium]
MIEEIVKLLRFEGRLLTFRLSKEEFLDVGNSHLAFGLFCTWLVGMGRWWDDPGANLLQHLGVGSIIYIFVLALILLMVSLPINSEIWSYKQVLTFVSLTSPPALLYAIPVERFTELYTARFLNVWFLALVATWRLALLLFFFIRFRGLSPLASIVATLLPVMAIIVTLTALNLERAAFNIMGGLRDSGTSNDEAYGVLFGLSLISFLLIIPTTLVYIGLILSSRKRK